MKACIQMLPRLKAEESIRAMKEIGAVLGLGPSETRRAFVQDLERRIQPGGRARGPIDPGRLAALGLGVRIVPRTPRASASAPVEGTAGG